MLASIGLSSVGLYVEIKDATISRVATINRAAIMEAVLMIDELKQGAVPLMEIFLLFSCSTLITTLLAPPNFCDIR